MKIIKCYWGEETEIEDWNCRKAERSAKYVLLNITLPAERELNLKCEKALSNYFYSLNNLHSVMCCCHNSFEHIHEILNGNGTAFIITRDTRSLGQKSWVVVQMIETFNIFLYRKLCCLQTALHGNCRNICICTYSF